jgi:hypothetical protein
MSKLAIRLLTLAIYATALVLVPMVASAKAESGSSRHVKKHKKQKSHGFSVPRSAGRAWPVSRPSSQPDAACSRGFECGKWPPPMYEDPQRNPDGGGM